MKTKLVEGRKYFVHRYRWTHEDRRKHFLKAFKNGKVTLLESTKDGWLYQAKPDALTKLNQAAENN